MKYMTLQKTMQDVVGLTSDESDIVLTETVPNCSLVSDIIIRNSDMAPSCFSTGDTECSMTDNDIADRVISVIEIKELEDRVDSCIIECVKSRTKRITRIDETTVNYVVPPSGLVDTMLKHVVSMLTAKWSTEC